MGGFLLTGMALATLCGLVEATQYDVYSCPLSSSKSFLSSSGNKDCSSSGKRDIPYGIRHTYLQIDSTCYDWGDWNYPRHLSCDSGELACCVQTRKLEHSGYTSCADKIGDFENAWSAQGKDYRVFKWNCQVYTTKMEEFLSNCYTSASTVFG